MSRFSRQNKIGIERSGFTLGSVFLFLLVTVTHLDNGCGASLLSIATPQSLLHRLAVNLQSNLVPAHMKLLFEETQTGVSLSEAVFHFLARIIVVSVKDQNYSYHEVTLLYLGTVQQ